MTTNPGLLDIGDTVTRLGSDRWRITANNCGDGTLADVDLMEVVCLDDAGAGWASVGMSEWVCPDDYHLIEREGKMTNEFRHRGKMQIVIDGKVRTYEGTVIISPGEKPTDAETQLRHKAVIRDEARRPFKPERP